MESLFDMWNVWFLFTQRNKFPFQFQYLRVYIFFKTLARVVIHLHGTSFLKHGTIRCFNYHCARQTLFEKVNKTDWTIWKQIDQVLAKQLLFGNEKLKGSQTAHIDVCDWVPAGYERFKTSLFDSVPNGLVRLTHCRF